MVGEMRDLETVDTSLKAAETGHLVFSTIHTADVSSTISRLVSFFPPDEQMNVRARIADNVSAIVSLRLLVNKKEDGRVPAVEVLRATRSIQECIRDSAKTPELVDYIARGRNDRMQSFDQHLLDLLKANKISVETALAAASNPTDFRTKLSLEGHESDDEDEVGKTIEAFEVESDGRF
jgi:twitching motility protein PilT